METITSFLNLLLFVTPAGWARSKTVVIETKLISQTASGTSRHVSISADGRYIVFKSSATNLVENFSDVDSGSNLFIRDTETGTTYLVVESGGSWITTGYPKAAASND